MIIGKVWGSTQILLATPLIEIHRLVVLPKARCSLHRHTRKWNAFIVTKGRLCVQVHKSDYSLQDDTWLRPGDMTSVAPGEKHQFFTGSTGAEAFEIYYPAPLSEDIVRDNCGARL